MIGPWIEVIWASVASLIGIIAISGAVVGFLFKPATVIERILLGVAALALIFPGYTSDFVGLSIFGGIVTLNYIASLKLKTRRSELKN